MAHLISRPDPRRWISIPNPVQHTTPVLGVPAHIANLDLHIVSLPDQVFPWDIGFPTPVSSRASLSVPGRNHEMDRFGV